MTSCRGGRNIRAADTYTKGSDLAMSAFYKEMEHIQELAEKLLGNTSLVWDVIGKSERMTGMFQYFTKPLLIV